MRLCYSLHELRVWEHVYIVKYKSYIRSIGYNIAKGGDVNTSEYNPAKLPEVREKMSLKKRVNLLRSKVRSYQMKRKEQFLKRTKAESGLKSSKKE